VSACWMSPRAVRRLSRDHHHEFVWAAADHAGIVWATDSSLRCWRVDRKTGSVTEAPLGSFAHEARQIVAGLLGAPDSQAHGPLASLVLGP
jgi:hypothetical protein